MKARNFVKIPLMMRLFTAVLMMGLLTSVGSMQNASSLESAKRAWELRDYNDVIAALENIRSANAADFVDGHLDYLLGRAAKADGRKGLAAANFHSVSMRDSVLKPYALQHLSQNARSAGNLMLERLYLAELAFGSPSSLPSAGASIRMAQNRLESRDHSEAIRLLENASSSQAVYKTKKADGRQSRALLGEAYLLNGDLARAKEIFGALINEMPDRPDDHSMMAAKALDLMDGGAGENSGLTETEHFQRANIYLFNREFSGSKKHLEAVIAKHPTGPRSAEAVFLIGRGYAQQADFAEALKWFERVLERYPESSAAKDALLNGASAYSRVGKPKEAITRYQSFIEKYPTDERLDRAYFNIVDVLRDQGEETEALKWCGMVRDKFRGRTAEAVAIFTEARIHIARDEWGRALAALDQLTGHPNLGGSSVPGGTSTAEIAFLRGFSLEQMRQYQQAIEVYLSIPDGRGEYYGWRATERLRSLANSEAARSFVDQKAGILFAALRSENAEARANDAKAILRLVSSPELRHKALDAGIPSIRNAGIPDLPPSRELTAIKGTKNSAAGKFIDLGLFDEAVPELEFSKGITDAYLLAKYYSRAGRADRGLAYVESTWRNVPRDIPLEVLPRSQLKLLYPAPFSEALIRHGNSRNVDPRFILAIMRQESRFDPDVKSDAAARGLMQFISTTSNRVAGQLGLDGFNQDDLYHPSTAIRFGSQYVSELFKRFPQQPEAVAASYNGGEDNMARWLARSRSGLPERYVPEIVYSQTKDYVAKVMANYRVYLFLYDDHLRPRKE